MFHLEKNNNSYIKTFYKNTDFTPDDVAKGLLLFLIFQTAVSLLYQIVALIGLTGSIFSYLFNGLLDACFLLVVYIVAKSRSVNPINQLRVKQAPNAMQAGLCLITSLVCIFGFSAITNCFMELLYSAGYNSVSGDVIIANWGSYILYTITICVLPAVCEEILFRGLVFSGLKKIGTKTAVFASAFIFMIMHGTPDQTVHQFILGIILALAFLVTNNLWVPILIHFFNNFIAVSISFFLYGDSSAEASGEVVNIYLWQYFIYAVISAVIASLLMYLILKGFSTLVEKQKNKNQQPAFAEPQGTIGSEINYRVVNSEQYSAEFTQEPLPVLDAGSPLQLQEADPNRFSKTGKFLLWMSIGWLVLQWMLSLIAGLTNII